jgi:hypothetical protein
MMMRLLFPSSRLPVVRWLVYMYHKGLVAGHFWETATPPIAAGYISSMFLTDSTHMHVCK